MTGKKILTIEAQTMWCDPHRPSKLSEKVQCDLVHLNDEQVKYLQQNGVTVNFDSVNQSNPEKFRGNWIRPKSSTPVPAKDWDGNPIPPNLFIGNGSTVVAAFRQDPWVNKKTGRSGMSLKLLGIRVKEFIKYDPDAQARNEADKILDEVSGGSDGFVFGSGGSDDSSVADVGNSNEVDEQDFDALFADAD